MSRIKYVLPTLFAIARWAIQFVRLSVHTMLTWGGPQIGASRGEIREWINFQQTEGVLAFEWQRVRRMETRIAILVWAVLDGRMPTMAIARKLRRLP